MDKWRMSINVDEEIYNSLKKIAKARNKFIYQLVDEMLLKQVEIENKEIEDMGSYFKWPRK